MRAGGRERHREMENWIVLCYSICGVHYETSPGFNRLFIWYYYYFLWVYILILTHSARKPIMGAKPP